MNKRSWTIIGLAILSVFSSAVASATTLKLVTTEWETFTDDGYHSQRLNAVVVEALKRSGIDASISVEREAFLGSGINSGRYAGRIDFIDLNPEQDNFAYSAPFIPLQLHLVSKTNDVERVRSFAQIRDSRIAVENRYAATPVLRLERDIKWSRNPNTYESINNLADERSNYLLTDVLFFNEFNRLLEAENEELLHRSTTPFYRTGLHLMLNRNVEGYAQILENFNQAITDMLADGTLNTLLGLSWIAADIDGDNNSELITSSTVAHDKFSLASDFDVVIKNTYHWDGSALGTPAIVINGEAQTDWSAARQTLLGAQPDSADSLRPSFLDENTYQRILSAW